jgi:hypothetical protein
MSKQNPPTDAMHGTCFLPLCCLLFLHRYTHPDPHSIKAKKDIFDNKMEALEDQLKRSQEQLTVERQQLNLLVSSKESELKRALDRYICVRCICLFGSSHGWWVRPSM